MVARGIVQEELSKIRHGKILYEHKTTGEGAAFVTMTPLHPSIWIHAYLQAPQNAPVKSTEKAVGVMTGLTRGRCKR